MSNKDDTDVILDDKNAIELELVDDTPEADKNRKPLTKDVLAEPEEAEVYSDKVKKRMNELRRATHDERREREKAERERDEAVTFAKANFQKAQALEKQLTVGEASYAGDMQEKAGLALQQAKEKHRKAYEAGDPEAIAEAVAEVAAAAHEQATAKHWASNARNKADIALQNKEGEVDSTTSRQDVQKQRTVEPDARATEWAKNNDWFGHDEVMTSLVYGVHEKLVKSGVHPIDDADEYYSTIDSEMRKRFPDHEWPDAQESDDKRAAPPAKKSAPAVAPVRRTTSGNKQKVTLTQTQVRMAEKFGLSLEQYARELLKLEGQS